MLSNGRNCLFVPAEGVVRDDARSHSCISKQLLHAAVRLATKTGVQYCPETTLRWSGRKRSKARSVGHRPNCPASAIGRAAHRRPGSSKGAGSRSRVFGLSFVINDALGNRVVSASRAECRLAAAIRRELQPDSIRFGCPVDHSAPAGSRCPTSTIGPAARLRAPSHLGIRHSHAHQFSAIIPRDVVLSALDWIAISLYCNSA